MAAVDVLRTPLCDTIGIELPIVQAPLGRVGSAALAAAVSNAGGLGMLGLSFDSDDEIRRTLRETQDLTDRPFGINLILHRDQRGRLATALDAGRPRVVSFHWSARPSWPSVPKPAGWGRASSSPTSPAPIPTTATASSRRPKRTPSCQSACSTA